MGFKLSIFVFTLLLIAISSDASPVRNQIVKIDKIESMNTELFNLVRDETDGKDSSADEKDDKDDKEKEGHEGHDHDSEKEGKDDKEKDDDKKDDENSDDDSPAESGSGIGGVPAGAQAGNPVCFPGSATVSLEGGETKRMEELSVGDRVAVGGGLYSKVFMFTHKLSNIKYEFVSIKTKSGACLRLTEGHYLPVNGAYVPASKAKLGDTVVLADGTSSNIVDVKRIQDVGLYNPQTTQGDIIVNGIRASTYTTAMELKMAHALLAPLRFACDRFGIRTSLLEAGADSVAGFTSRFA